MELEWNTHTHTHTPPSTGILREFLAAAEQLLRFKSTREALLMVGGGV